MTFITVIRPSHLRLSKKKELQVLRSLTYIQVRAVLQTFIVYLEEIRVSLIQYFSLRIGRDSALNVPLIPVACAPLRKEQPTCSKHKIVYY
jgi:hypothetical protein